MITKTILFGAAFIAVAGIVAVYDQCFGLKSAFQGAHAADEHKSGSHGKNDGDSHDHWDEDEHAEESVVKLSPAQIEAAKIEVTSVDSSVLATCISVPGAVILDPDPISCVAAKVAGSVGELRKRLGNIVVLDEVIAVVFLTPDSEVTAFGRGLAQPCGWFGLCVSSGGNI